MSRDNLTILAIDDLEDNLTVLRALIAESFPEAGILTASDGPSGIELAIAHNPDVVLLDVLMPGMDGFEVCRAMKGNERTARIPVLFVTAAQGDTATRVAALEAGGDGFLSKPIDSSELTAQIRAMAKVHRLAHRERVERSTLEALVAERTAALEQQLEERRRAEESLVETTRHLERSQTAMLNLLEDLRSENAARNTSERKYRLIAENATDVIWVLDAEQQRFTYVSPSVERLRGFSPEEVIEQTLAETIAPESLARISHVTEERLDELRRGERIVHTDEIEQIRKDGTTVWTETTTRFVVNPENGRVEIHGVTRDIEERKRTERRREAERELLRICQLSSDATEMMRDLAVFFKNLAGCDAFGLRLRRGEDYPYFETRGFSDDFVEAERSLCARDIDGDLLRDAGGNPVLECMCGNILNGRFDPSKPFFTRHGSFWSNHTTALLASTSEEDRLARTRNRCNGEGYESVALIPLRSHGRIYGLIQFNDRRIGRYSKELIDLLEHLSNSVALVIAKQEAEEERRTAEDAVHRSEAQYRRLIDLLPNGVIVHTNGVAAMANDAAVRIFGMRGRDDIVGKPIIELVHPDFRQAVKERVELSLDSGEDAPLLEEKFLRANGESFDVEVTAIPVVFDGRPSMLTVFDDITERKSAQTLLRDSEARYRLLVESSLFPVTVTEAATGRVLFVNDAAAAFFGIARSEATAELAKSFWAEVSDRDDILARLRTDGVVRSSYAQLKTKRGDARDVLISCCLIEFQGANCVFSIISDITDRVHAEEALRESEEKFRSLFETMAQGVVYQERDGRISSANPAAERILGLSSHDLCSRTSENREWDCIREDGGPFPGSEHPAMVALRTGREVQGAVMGIWNPALGERRWVQINAVPQFEPGDDRPERVYAAFTDITEMKRAAEDVARAKDYAENLIDTANAIVVELDTEGRILRFNKEAQKVTGYSLEELCGRSWFEAVVPRDRFPEVWDVFEKLPEGALLRNFENPIVTKSGETRIISWQNSEIRWQGETKGVISFGVDVTENRRGSALVQAERDLGLAMSAATTLEETLEACLATALKVSGLDAGGIYLSDERGGLELAAHAGLSPDFIAAVTHYAPGTPNAEIVKRGEPVYALHSHTDVELDGGRRGEGLRATAIIPIRDRGESVACLNVASHSLERVSDWARLALEDIAARVGAVIVSWRSEEARHRIERDYKTLFDEMLDGFAVHEIICDESGSPVDYRFLALNPAFERITGLEAASAVGRTVLELMPNTEKSWIEAYGRVALDGEPAHFESYARELKRHFEVTAFQPNHGQFACIFSDITERKQLEEQYNQAQKMEAVGRLAGGVAHDLNNMLTPILGYAELLQNSMPAGDAHHEAVREVYQAGTRARDLVRQLLAFSRKQTLEMKRVDLNSVIRGFENLLRRALREDVRLSFRLEDRPPPIRGDVGQIEQILMNLAINAQDAMPDGGEISISTGAVDLDEAFAESHPEVAPGPYLALSFSDTGTGMDADTMRRIFEPFFTTKPVGQGTGLGLSTVYGIVKQHEGAVSVYSEVGVGTTFRLYFPALAAAGAAAAPADREKISDSPAGVPTETIMVVEDSEMVRKLAVAILKKEGYEVLCAANAEECMAVLSRREGPLHLLLTDVVMPGLNGKALYDVVSSLCPNLKVIYMSGYAQDVISNRGVIDAHIDFVQKPFSVRALSAKIRAVLDRP